MKQIKLKWKNVEGATGYILRTKNLSSGSVKEINVGNNLQHDLELNEAAFYEWSVLPYNTEKIGKKSEKRVIKVTKEVPLEIVKLISPEDGITIELEETINSNKPLPVYFKYPGNSQALIPPETPLQWSINGQENIDGFYINIAKGGNTNQLMVDKEDVGYNTFYNFENAEYMTSYSWQVIPYNENGEAENCPWWVYTTKPQFDEDAPKTTIGHILSKENTITLPVTIENFHDITSFKFDILYNTSGEEYLRAIDIIPNENLDGDFNTTIETGLKSTLSIEWTGNAKTLPDDEKLLELVFDRIKEPGGTTQIEFSHVHSWTNINGQLNDESHFSFYHNGYINTKIDENDVPLPVKVISPNSGVLKLKVEKRRLKWMSGGQAANITGFYLNIKKFGEIIVDHLDKGFTLFHELDLEYDSTYHWQVIPYNENGECENSPWWTFTTESEIKRNSPIYTIGNIETSDTEFVIPITVKNFDKVQIYEFKIEYDPSIILATDVEVLNSLNSVENWNISNISESGIISTSWFVLPQGVSPELDNLTLSDDTEILRLKFSKVSNGETEVKFVDNPIPGIDCYTGYYDNGTEIFNDEPNDDYYKSGFVKTLNSSR